MSLLRQLRPAPSRACSGRLLCTLGFNLRCHAPQRVAALQQRTGLTASAARVTHPQQQRTAVLAAAASAAPAGTQPQSPGIDVPEDFDLPVAIALAAAAFEAYLEPVGANEEFKEVTVNNTHTTYTDRDFLRRNFDGLLQLTIHGAKGLKAVNITGGSDPYVVATLGDSSATTEVVWGDVNPVWKKETHNLYVPQRSKAVLKLRVIDKNKLRSDIDLGVVMTGLDVLLDKPGRKVELPLKGTNAQGHLVVSALFLPFAQEIIDAAIADETMQAPEAPEEVTQLATQFELASQLQDELTAKVQEIATDLKQKAEEGLGELPVADLQGIIARIAAARLAKGQDAQQAQLPAAAAAVVAAEAARGSDLPEIVQEAMPQAWKALALCAGKMVEMFKPIAFVENKDTDTQAWVYLCEELQEVVVAFRGTEQVKWKDLVSDLNLVPTTLDEERTGAVDLGLGSLPMPFAQFRKNKELMVHSGFLAAYDSVKAKVFRIVDQATAGCSAEQPWNVFITGHSLGGALATLAAYDMAGRRGPAAAGITPHMYTYGAPRVGNKAFADDFNKRLKGNSWRITNAYDIVPSVPRLMGYAHVSRGVRLEANGGLKFEESSKDVLGEGREVAEVITDLASQAMDVAKGTKGLDEVVDSIREHEMQILNSLVDGSALGQHMEDFYLATLKQAVLAANPALAGRVQQALEEVAASSAPAAPAAGAAAAADAPSEA